MAFNRISTSVCLVLFTFVISACSASAPAPKSIPFTMDQSGISVLNTPQRIDFGRTDHSVIPAMSKLAGSTPTSQSVCGDITRVGWAETSLFFKSGDFRGWQTLTAKAGVTCG